MVPPGAKGLQNKPSLGCSRWGPPSMAPTGQSRVRLLCSPRPRHADTIEVVVTALLAHQAGAGHRTIAADLDVPVHTVRSWLRRATSRAEWLRQRATVRAHQLDPMLETIAPTGSTLGDALAALGVAAAAWRRRLGMAASPWQIIGLIAGGRLLAPVRPAPSG